MEKEQVIAIPRTRQVYYSTYANLPVTGLTGGDLGYATDRLVLYRWSGAAWEEITIHSSSGTLANIPTIADMPEGSLYQATDTGDLYQAQAGVWVIISTQLRSIKLEFTRVLNTANGNVAYTGIGFRPRAIIFIGASLNWAGYVHTIGITGVTPVSGSFGQTSVPTTRRDTVYCIDFWETAANTANAYVLSLDVDGFTLTWAKSGTPTQTLLFGVLCLG